MSTEPRLRRRGSDDSMASDGESDYSMATSRRHGAGSIFDPFSDTSTYTSVDQSMRSRSPAPSVRSMTSSMRTELYRTEHGRGLNNYSDVYNLPADEPEMDRLDRQHELFTGITGKYPPPMDQIMADNVPGETKTVIDLGCGSGSWILDVCRDYPNCSAVAVDLIPMQVTSVLFHQLEASTCLKVDSRDMPMNLRSEVDDLNLGLEHYFGDFNVVHARLICAGIKDYENLVAQMTRCLKPGGMLTLSENDFHAYDANHKRIDLDIYNEGGVSPTAPWTARWLAYAEHCVRQKGGYPDAATHWAGWMRGSDAFEEIVIKDYWLPLSVFMHGNSAEDVRSRKIAIAMRDNMLTFVTAGRPMLLGCGFDPQLVELLERNAEKELMDGLFPIYGRLQTIYGIKKQLPDQGV